MIEIDRLDGFTHYTTRMLRNSAMPGSLTPRYRVCDMNNLGAKGDANLGLWTVEVVPPAGESAPIKGDDS